MLGGNFKDVIGEGDENKQKFLTECSRELSNGNTRDLECVDVRPGSIIVDIEGAPEDLVAMEEEVQTEKAFVLDGFPELAVEHFHVDRLVASQTTTKKPHLLNDGSVSVFAH